MNKLISEIEQLKRDLAFKTEELQALYMEFKNQSNFASGTSVTVAGDNFQRKTPEGSTNPKIFSGEFDFNLSVSAGDLIQIKANRSTGGSTDTLITVVFTES